MTQLLDSESPYLERARARGKQYANRRGLLNSSIAAGATEAAAIDAALPIATTDANIAANERAMRSTEFQQARGLHIQQLMQFRGFDHDTAQREADRELSKLLQERDHEVQQLMQQRGFDHDAAQRAADRSLQLKLQSRQFSHARSMQAGQQEFAGEQADLDRDLAQRQGDADRALRISAGIDASTRDINDDYQRYITAIESNPEIPAERKGELREHYGWVRDQNIAALAADLQLRSKMGGIIAAIGGKNVRFHR